MSARTSKNIIQKLLQAATMSIGPSAASSISRNRQDQPQVRQQPLNHPRRAWRGCEAFSSQSRSRLSGVPDADRSHPPCQSVSPWCRGSRTQCPSVFHRPSSNCLAVSVVVLAAKHQGSFMSLAWTQTTGAHLIAVSRDKGVASTHSNPIRSRARLTLGGGHGDIAAEPY